MPKVASISDLLFEAIQMPQTAHGKPDDPVPVPAVENPDPAATTPRPQAKKRGRPAASAASQATAAAATSEPPTTKQRPESDGHEEGDEERRYATNRKGKISGALPPDMTEDEFKEILDALFDVDKQKVIRRLILRLHLH